MEIYSKLEVPAHVSSIIERSRQLLTDTSIWHFLMIDNVADGNLLSSFVFAVLVVIVAILCYGRRNHRSSLPGLRCRPFLLYYIFFRSIYGRRLKDLPPICLILQVICGLCKIFDKEKIVRVWLFNRPFVLFFKPETVEVVLSSPVTIEKSSEYEFLHPWLGTGLLTSKGDKWKKRRKMLTPAFHFRILEDFLPIFDEQSRVLVSKLKNSMEKPWVDVVPFITMCTLDIICQTAMGVRINAQSGGCSSYVSAIYGIGDVMVYRVLRPWLWLDAIFYLFPVGRKFRSNLQLIHNFTRRVIKEKKEVMLKNYSEKNGIDKNFNESPSSTKRKRVFLELLLEHHLANKSFTEEDIREEVDTFMFEGHDTTAMAICWTLYNLGLHPDVQEEVHREIDCIFADDHEKPITRDDLAEMKYLECVIKETLRLYPSVPFIGRELREDIKVLDYRIRAGSMCFIFPLMLHRDPESFPNPEKFEPERFFPENCSRRHPYAYVPFSAGPRNCIGQKFAMMEEKVIVANVLRNFRVESLDHRDKVNLIPDLIIRNVDPLRMRFIPRC